jgi:ABC-type glycerol-3-phosphate transport system substrate-binding protein
MSFISEVDKTSSTPLYKQVKSYILRLIHENEEDSSILPPEIEISRQLDISRATVRAAFLELVNEGVLERVPGKGTFIKEKPNTLHFANWLTTEEPTCEHVLDLLQEFNRGNSDGTIKNLSIPYEEIERQLLILAAGGEAPDITSLIYLWTPLLAYNGALESLDHLYTPDFVRDQYQQTIKGVSYKSSIYGVNWINAPTILVYHKDILEEFRGQKNLDVEYFDELLDYFIDIHEKSSGEIIPFSISVLDDELFLLFILTNFLRSFGGGIFNDEGEIIFNSGETQDAFRWLRNFIYKGHVNVTNKLGKNRQLLSIGKLAFLCEGPWMRCYIRNMRGGKDWDLKDIGYSTLPKSPKGIVSSVLWNHSLSIFKQCKNKKLAEEFIKHLVLNPKTAERYYQRTGGLPILISEIENNPVYNDELGLVVKKQLETAEPVVVHYPSTFNLVVTVCAKAAREILIGQTSIDSTLNNHAAILKALQAY